MKVPDQTNTHMDEREQELEDLRRALGGANCDRRDLYISRLLGGGYFRSAQEALDTGEQYGLNFPNRYFLLLSARPETWGDLFTTG